MARMQALISTIEPVAGGVASKLGWLAAELLELGITPVLAWYEPWSRTPALSVPATALLSGRVPGERHSTVWQRYAGHGIGCWLPELEFTHFLPGKYWRRLIGSADLHLAVTGNPLCAYRYLAADVPFLAWIGSDWHGDRHDRVRRFPPQRQLLDRAINAPVLRWQERQVLRAHQGHLLTISQATGQTLQRLSGRPTAGVLYRPPERCFTPQRQRTVPWRLGFSGRYSDPRKQLGLLLDAVVLLQRQGQPLQLELTGEAVLDPAIRTAIVDRGLEDMVLHHPLLTLEALAAVIQAWDLFVIPSSQEGLCIAALEAMACGVPVVSTRCGGPQDFVIPQRTGLLVEQTPSSLADAIREICGDRERRAALSTGAQAWVNEHASQQESRRRLRQHLGAAFPALSL